MWGHIGRWCAAVPGWMLPGGVLGVERPQPLQSRLRPWEVGFMLAKVDSFLFQKLLDTLPCLYWT